MMSVLTFCHLDPFLWNFHGRNSVSAGEEHIPDYGLAMSSKRPKIPESIHPVVRDIISRGWSRDACERQSFASIWSLPKFHQHYSYELSICRNLRSYDNLYDNISVIESVMTIFCHARHSNSEFLVHKFDKNVIVVVTSHLNGKRVVRCGEFVQRGEESMQSVARVLPSIVQLHFILLHCRSKYFLYHFWTEHLERK